LGTDVLSGFDDDNRFGDRVFAALLGRLSWWRFRQPAAQKGEVAAGSGHVPEMGVMDSPGSVNPAAADAIQGFRTVGWGIQGTVSTVSDGRHNRSQHSLLLLGYSSGSLRGMGEDGLAGKPPDGGSSAFRALGIDDCHLLHLEGDKETEPAGSDMKGSQSLLTRVSTLVALLSGLGCGAVKEKTVIATPPAYAQAKTAAIEELVTLVNERYSKVESITVRRCEVEFTGGSIDDGYLEKYRKANGLLIAQSPDSIFVNILNPLTNSTVVVMASNNEQFQIWIPSKNTFVTGRTDVTPEESNPVYNVRPSHIMEGILVEPIPLNDPKHRYFVVEDEDGKFRYYVLGVFELKENASDSNLLRRIWIERSTMQLKKQQYYEGAEVVSTITYDGTVELEGRLVNTQIKIQRPRDRYAIAFRLEPDNIKLDRELEPDAFKILQPAGAEVVVVDQQDSE
jgi:outer membrane lipoprotein-sorting protein